jgi:hypothetical protein
MKLAISLVRLCSLVALLALTACAGAGQPATSAPAGGSAASTPSAVVGTGYPAQPTPAPTAAAGYPAQLTPAGTAAAGYPPASGYPAPTAPAASTQPSADLQAIGRQAAAELAKKLSVDVSQIQVTSTEATSWPDSSLGCPQAGMAYSQVVTPGYKVVLTYKQTQYEYHTDQRGTIVLCNPK